MTRATAELARIDENTAVINDRYLPPTIVRQQLLAALEDHV
jgi:hypothetical protein